MRRQALVIGVGGHARVVLSLLAAEGRHSIAGLLDIGTPRQGEAIMGVPVLGGTSRLHEFVGRSDVDVYLGIGDNAGRRHWWRVVREFGLPTPSLLSPHAIIDPTARLGEASIVCARAFVGPQATIGDNVLLNTACITEHEVWVGSHSHLAPACTMAGRSRIGEGCFIGAGATVIDRISITAEVTVGAGGAVVEDIDVAGVYVGVPARLRAASALVR